MTMLQSIQTVFTKFAVFAGAASRPEFWWFTLFSALCHLALNSMNIVAGDSTVYLGASLSGLFGIVVLVPTLAVTVRRLRDTNRTWTQLFWLLLPVAGLIVLIVHLAEPSRTPVEVSSARPNAVPVI